MRDIPQSEWVAQIIRTPAFAESKRESIQHTNTVSDKVENVHPDVMTVQSMEQTACDSIRVKNKTNKKREKKNLSATGCAFTHA